MIVYKGVYILVFILSQKIADFFRTFIRPLSHHLHAYGRSFGFPLVITLSQSLQQLTGQIDMVDTDTLVLVRAHLDALQAGLNVGLHDEGGKIGRKLVQELHRANREIVRRSPGRRSTGSG